MKVFLYATLLFILQCTVVHAMVTELMYNPPESDNEREYIEIIFNEAISLENWTISDESSSDTLILINGSGKKKINLIVEEGYHADYFSNIDLSSVNVYSAGSKIGNGLNNDGDTLTLYNQEQTPITSVTYDGSIANGDGNALCFSQEETYACTPSPGEENQKKNNDDENDEQEDEESEEEINESTKESYVHIKKVYSSGNNSLYFCETFSVEVTVFNHQTTKETIYVYLKGFEPGSSITINAHVGQQITIPLNACNSQKKHVNGEHILIAEGFNTQDQEIVTLHERIIEQKEEQHIQLQRDTTKREKENDIKSINDRESRVEETKEIIYDTSVEIEKKIMYYLIFLVAVLAGYYIVKK